MKDQAQRVNQTSNILVSMVFQTNDRMPSLSFFIYHLTNPAILLCMRVPLILHLVPLLQQVLELVYPRPTLSKM